MHRLVLVLMAVLLAVAVGRADGDGDADAVAGGEAGAAGGNGTLAERLLARRGWTLLAQGEHAGARRWFAAETGRHPEALSPRVGYALAAAASNYVRSAAWAMRRSVQLSPGAFAALRAVGRAEALRPMLWRLVRSYERALLERPEDEDAAFILAAVHYLLHEDAAARNVLQHGRGRGDFSDSAANLRQLIAGGFDRSAPELSLPGEEAPDEEKRGEETLTAQERPGGQRKPNPRPLGAPEPVHGGASDSRSAEDGEPQKTVRRAEGSRQGDRQGGDHQAPLGDEAGRSQDEAAMEPRVDAASAGVAGSGEIRAEASESVGDESAGGESKAGRTGGDGDGSGTGEAGASDAELPPPDLVKLRDGIMDASRTLDRFTEKLRRAIERSGGRPDGNRPASETAQPDATEGTGR